ncbi:hypothetical protein ABEB36_010321 [Hypothenemus hampei]|uniref:2-aminoethanethiol dioxygenase n=1 Tax=Hypothenemus hampei TaxID=57062 RepID=A0ABD1EJR1_HYPHA
MSKTYLAKVLKQALNTFTSKNSEIFSTNFATLIALLDKVTTEHVDFPTQILDPKVWTLPDKAPVSCITIYEDSKISMGIFILKPNGKLPLHNHPDMHGLIKVLAGQVKIVSYSINTEKTKEIDLKSHQGSMDRLAMPPVSNKPGLVTAELVEITVANSNSPPCVLNPNFKNLHEIQSVNEPAAFLDILSPPYDCPEPGSETRTCSYYSKLCQVSPDVYRLQETISPSWYWTDSIPYTGPDLEAEVIF